MKHILSRLLLLCICLSGCCESRITSIGFNKTFEEISLEAYNNKKPFCIVLTDSLNYPYSLYLKLVGELMQKDSLASRETAKSLLELETL